MKLKSRLIVPLCCLLLSGCITTGSGDANGPASALRAEIEKSSLAAGLDPAARTKAAAAEFEALENGLAGVPVKWNASSALGEVTPDPAYVIGEMRCRRYQHVISSGGQTRSATATACRDAAGRWVPLD
jgi:surface antigen